MDLSIRARLAIGFGLVLLLVMGSLGVIFVQAEHVEALKAQREQTVDPALDATTDLQRAYLNQSVALRGYALAPTATNHDRYAARLATVAAQWDRLLSLRLAGGNREDLSRLRGLNDEYLAASERLREFARTGDRDKVREVEIELTQLREHVLEGLRELESRERDRVRALQDQQDVARNQMLGTVTVLALLILLVGSTTAIYTILGVRRPVVTLVEAARALAKNRYEPALAIAAEAPPPGTPAPQNELTELSHAFGRMAQALRHRTARIEAQAEIARRTSQSIELEPLCRGVLEALGTFCQSQLGAVYLHEDGELVRIASLGTVTTAERLKVGEGLPGEAALTRSTKRISDVQDPAWRLQTGFGEATAASLIAAPVIFDQKLLGVLVLGSVGAISDDSASILEDASQSFCTALQNALAHRNVLSLARELEQTNDELQAQNEEVQAQNEEIQSQNEELEAQKQQLLEMDRQKDELLSVASHELKTPLTSLKLQIELLTRKWQNGTAPEPSALTKIGRQADRLKGQVDRLLDYSRARMGRLRVERQVDNVGAIVAEVVEQLRALHPQRAITLKVSPGQHLADVDRPYFEQVVRNLVENACRYSDETSEVQLQVGRAGQDVFVSVKDHGIGIKKENLEKLFQAYYRSEKAEEVTSEGMGLGLYVTHAIVQAHGGKIRAESEPGQYSIFTVTLPAAAAASVARAG